MDQRFPKWLRTVVTKLDFLGVPNLGPLLCGVAVISFVAHQSQTIPMARFLFSPELILEGEWWRLVSFLFTAGMTTPLSLIFFVLYTYFVTNMLEAEWGPGPLTCFVLMSYLGAIIGGFVTHLALGYFPMTTSMRLTFYILENISLAFGTLFPEMQLNFYFVIPIRAKWFALVAGVMLAWEFLMGGMASKIFLPFALSPYLIFFGPMLVRYIKDWYRVKQNRKRFDKDMWR